MAGTEEPPDGTDREMGGRRRTWPNIGGRSIIDTSRPSAVSSQPNHNWTDDKPRRSPHTSRVSLQRRVSLRDRATSAHPSFLVGPNRGLVITDASTASGLQVLPLGIAPHDELLQTPCRAFRGCEIVGSDDAFYAGDWDWHAVEAGSPRGTLPRHLRAMQPTFCFPLGSHGVT